VDDGFALLDAEAAHDRIEAIGGEDAQRSSSKADVEFRLAGIALATVRPRSWLSIRRLS
jgi:hypothetical protein